jgi:hypothetical protein
VVKTFKKEIHDRIQDITQAESGSKEWLKVYMSVLSDFMKNMSEDQSLQVEAKVDEWNQEGPEEEYKQE